MSTLSLEKNSHVSSSKCTKHIKAKYFFIKHYYDSGDICLRYCPTEQMWADVLTKPLQGMKFRQMRAMLMNCPIAYSEDSPLLALKLVQSSTTIPMKPQLQRTTLSPQECVAPSSFCLNLARPNSGGKLHIDLSKPIGKKKVKWPVQPLKPQLATSTHHRRIKTFNPIEVSE
jgi:hypothetical protein